jgi:hypothetical protein
MIAVKEIKKYFSEIEDDTELLFVIVAPEDIENLGRSYENKVNIINQRPFLVLDFVGAGTLSTADDNTNKNAIFFTLQ